MWGRWGTAAAGGSLVLAVIALASLKGRPVSLKGCALGTILSHCDPNNYGETGFDLPVYNKNGAEVNENSRAWTSSGVLDEQDRAASITQDIQPGKNEGEIQEYKDKGDDDIDTVSNGDFIWPYDLRKLHKKRPVVKKVVHPPCCQLHEQWHAKVHRIKEAYNARVIPPPRIRTRTIIKTVPYPVYKVKTEYIPVYDDPFWNPKSDGRLAGEGIGSPQMNPFGARSYKDGAWYERNKRRKNMLDRLGGTLDNDRDVDQPADLGVWWADSLPSNRLASSLDDGF